MSELTVADLYQAGWERHLELAAELDDDDGIRDVRACPGWTVRDVYSHLAGLQADVLGGRVEGAGSDEWTSRQVAERADRTLTDNVAEYRELGPAMVEALRGFPIERLAVDQWAHEQDVRCALGRPGNRDVPVVGWSMSFIMGNLDRGRRKAGSAALRVEGSSGTWSVGEGDPVATIRADDFDLLRAVLGRRSPAQMRSMVVAGDPAVIDGLAFFGPRPDDLVE